MLFHGETCDLHTVFALHWGLTSPLRAALCHASSGAESAVKGSLHRGWSALLNTQLQARACGSAKEPT